MAGRKQRGRGGGRASGYHGGKGGGRGGSRGGRGDGSRGRGRGRGLGYVTMDEINGDYVVEIVPSQPSDNSRRDAPPPSARGQQHTGKGRGFGGDYKPGYSDNSDHNYYSRYSTPVQRASPGPGSSRGNGHQHGRGRWGIAGPDVDMLGPKDRSRKRHLGSKLRTGNASLSQLLYEDRPFLKPITFVRSKATPTLFLRDEEIFKPVAEEAGEREASHVPTAERVYQIFHGGNAGPQPSEVLSDEEELLEVDYADLGRFMNEIESAPAPKTNGTTPAAATAATSIATSIQKDQNQPVVTTTEEEPTGFYIDTKPSPVQGSSTSTNVIAVEHPGTGILGEDIGEDDDDEIIVYVAPHPRNSKLTPAHLQSSPLDATTLPPSASATSVAAPVHQKKTYDAPQAPALPPNPERMLWSEPAPEPILKDIVVPAPSPIPAPAPAFKDFSFSLLSSSPKPTHRGRWPRRIARLKAARKSMFGTFGALRAEETLRELDPRHAEQRRGDSDVDWGGSTSGMAEADDSEMEGGMLVDRDIETNALVAFVRGMGVAGQAHVSAGDLEDEARIRLEDADQDEENETAGDSGEDTELELADVEQGILAVEDGSEYDEVAPSSEDDDDDTSEDEEVTPKRSFQARLERVRSRTAGRPIQDMMREELDQERERNDDPNSDSDSNIDGEDSIIAQIQDFLDENDDILHARDRKQRNRLFRAISNGKIDLNEFIDSSPKRKRDKNVPAELYDQWERDRAKKAERKRLRELERIAAAEPFTPTKKKGKKARKARQAAAAAAPVDLETVVEHMRHFVADLESAPTLSLPPMMQHVRKSVHELAHAFNLKSKSEGNGAARYTKLLKTTLSGVRVDERKVLRILGKPAPAPAAHGKGKGKAGGKTDKIRPRDGEVVGGAAPKIDGSNVGFQMLSAMGWAEGSRIGTVGGVGLDVPLLGVIKTTKLGLGASSRRG